MSNIDTDRSSSGDMRRETIKKEKKLMQNFKQGAN